MRDFMAVAKALGDVNRVRAVLALRGRELCVCQIIELLGLAPSTVSKHMTILKQAALVSARKEGRWIHYRLTGSDGTPEAKEAIRWVHKSLAEDPIAKADAEVLLRIVKADKEKLCANQRK